MALSNSGQRAYSPTQGTIGLAPEPIIGQRQPIATDRGDIGQIWIDVPDQLIFICTGTIANATQWARIEESGGGGFFSDLLVTPGLSSLEGGLTAYGTTQINVNENFNTSINTGTSTGTVTIGSTAHAGAIAVDSASTITLQSADSAAGAIVINASGAAGGVNIQSGSNAVNINPSINQPTNINTGTSTGAVTIGSTAHAGAIAIDSATSIALSAGGIVSVAPATGSVASPTATQTINARAIVATFTGFTTANTASQVFTIVSSSHVAGSGVLVSVANKGTNDAEMTITRVNTTTAGTIAITTVNNGAAALNGDVVITVWIIS